MNKLLTGALAAIAMLGIGLGTADAQCCGTHDGTGNPALAGLRCETVSEQLAALPDNADPNGAPGNIAGCYDDGAGNCGGGTLGYPNSAGMLPFGPGGCSCVDGSCNHDADPTTVDAGGQACTNAAVEVCHANSATTAAAAPGEGEGTTPCCGGYNFGSTGWEIYPGAGIVASGEIACNRAAHDPLSAGAPGCIEALDVRSNGYSTGTCAAGGFVASDPRDQSNVAGCFCLDGGPGASGCISDSSMGRWMSGAQANPSTATSPPPGTDQVCIRDSVVACIERGAWHCVNGPGTCSVTP